VFATKWTWRREVHGDFTVAFTNIKDLPEGEEKAGILATVEANKRSKKSTLAELRGCIVIRRLAARVCQVKLAGQGVLGGWVPGQRIPGVLTRYLLKYTLSTVEVIRSE
jgi:hypothetical protein